MRKSKGIQMARIKPKRKSQTQSQSHRFGATALYIRVSTDKQVEDGFSLDAQRQRLDAYCAAQQWQVNEDHVYIDAGVSGKTDARPAFREMMLAAQSGKVKRIVAIKLDRLARNTKNILETVETLNDAGCDLALLNESFDTGTPHGKFALTMFAAIAELEASQITEQVMMGKTQKASEGGYNGAYCPLGYDYNEGAFVPNKDAETVSYIFEQFTAGKSMSRIATELNDAGNPTQRGGKWYAGTVRYILNNGFYAGITQWDDVEAKGSHPAIITPGMYEDAHNRLQSMKPGPQTRKQKDIIGKAQ